MRSYGIGQLKLGSASVLLTLMLLSSVVVEEVGAITPKTDSNGGFHNNPAITNNKPSSSNPGAVRIRVQMSHFTFLKTGALETPD